MLALALTSSRNKKKRIIQKNLETVKDTSDGKDRITHVFPC